jgi:hypothetical protein
MVGFQHVDSKTAERLRDLADRARVTLIAAGIPAFESGSRTPRGGAKIEVDTGDDKAGGVYISWTFSQELTDEISGYLLSGHTSHAVIQYSGKIRLAMRDAIIAILVAAGMSASVSKDDMRPLSVALSE